MLSIEQSLSERLPWLAQYPRIRRPVADMLGRLADEQGFNRVLEQIDGASGFDFVERAMDVLGISYHVNQRERENIPVDGPLLVVANHPLGMQDALALLHLVGSVRSDVRILGNDWLAAVPQLDRLLLPVDVFGKGTRSCLRDIYRALDKGEALIVFPAGEVSRFGPAGLRDRHWSDGFARLSMRRKVPVLPVHVAACNSAAFYGVSLLAKPLSTAMLPREAIVGNRRIDFSIGALVDASEIERRSGASPAQSAKLMRRHVYRVGRRRGLVFGGMAPLAHPESAELVVAELAKAEKLADLADGKQALLLQGSSDSATLREIWPAA